AFGPLSTEVRRRPSDPDNRLHAGSNRLHDERAGFLSMVRRELLVFADDHGHWLIALFQRLGGRHHTSANQHRRAQPTHPLPDLRRVLSDDTPVGRSAWRSSHGTFPHGTRAISFEYFGIGCTAGRSRDPAAPP